MLTKMNETDYTIVLSHSQLLLLFPRTTLSPTAIHSSILSFDALDHAACAFLSDELTTFLRPLPTPYSLQTPYSLPNVNRCHYRNLDRLVLGSNPTKQLHPPNSRVQLPDLARHFPSLFRNDRFEAIIEVHALVG